MRSAIRRVVEFFFPSVAHLYRNLRDELARSAQSLDTPWGFTLAGHKEMAAGNFEPEETELVRELLQEVDTLVNIGANVGYYCCHALSMGKSVIAIEPMAQNLHFLMRNIKENGWEARAEIFPIALGEKTGILDMWGGGTGASLVSGWAGVHESYVTQVPVLTLDRILGERLRGKKALVVVDVEGAEYDLFRSAEKALNNAPKPIWMVEIGQGRLVRDGEVANPNFEKTFELIFNSGYMAFTADSARLSIDMQAVKDVARSNSSFSTHNFLFR